MPTSHSTKLTTRRLLDSRAWHAGQVKRGFTNATRGLAPQRGQVGRFIEAARLFAHHCADRQPARCPQDRAGDTTTCNCITGRYWRRRCDVADELALTIVDLRLGTVVLRRWQQSSSAFRRHALARVRRCPHLVPPIWLWRQTLGVRVADRVPSDILVNDCPRRASVVGKSIFARRLKGLGGDEEDALPAVDVFLLRGAFWPTRTRVSYFDRGSVIF